MEVGAHDATGYGEKRTDRLARRNGYLDCGRELRAGAVELRIPKLRDTRKIRAAASLHFWYGGEWRRRPSAAIRPAYIGGSSARSVDDLLKALGMSRISEGGKVPGPAGLRRGRRAGNGIPLAVHSQQVVHSEPTGETGVAKLRILPEGPYQDSQ